MRACGFKVRRTLLQLRAQRGGIRLQLLRTRGLLREGGCRVGASPREAGSLLFQLRDALAGRVHRGRAHAGHVQLLAQLVQRLAVRRQILA